MSLSRDLHCAIGSNDCQRVKRILQKNETIVDLSLYGSQCPLHYAIQKQSLEIVHLLLQFNANVNITDGYDWTPLHYACRENHYDIVQLLIKYGANVNVTDKGEYTPLILACIIDSDSKIIKLLLENGADINFKRFDGSNAISLSTAKHKQFLCEWICKQEIWNCWINYNGKYINFLEWFPKELIEDLINYFKL